MKVILPTKKVVSEQQKWFDQQMKAVHEKMGAYKALKQTKGEGEVEDQLLLQLQLLEKRVNLLLAAHAQLCDVKKDKDEFFQAAIRGRRLFDLFNTVSSLCVLAMCAFGLWSAFRNPALGLVMVSLGWAVLLVKIHLLFPISSWPSHSLEFCLRLFLSRATCEAILGDLDEGFALDCERFGRPRAQVLYACDLTRSMWPIIAGAARKLFGMGTLAAFGDWLRRHL